MKRTYPVLLQPSVSWGGTSRRPFKSSSGTLRVVEIDKVAVDRLCPAFLGSSLTPVDITVLKKPQNDTLISHPAGIILCLSDAAADVTVWIRKETSRTACSFCRRRFFFFFYLLKDLKKKKSLSHKQARCASLDSRSPGKDSLAVCVSLSLSVCVCVCVACQGQCNELRWSLGEGRAVWDHVS